MTHDTNPEGLSINGERADEDSIALMEGYASDLLIDFPAEYNRQYGYSTEYSGSIALFSTCVFEEEAESGSVGAVIIAKGKPENVKLEIAFNYDNQPNHLFFTSEEEFADMTSIIQDLLDNGELQPADAIVLRHLQSIVFCLMAAMKPEHIGVIPNDESPGDFRHVADIIRSQVDKNTDYGIRTKVWGLPFDDDSSLTVASNEVIGELGVDLKLPFPKLMVEYEDRTGHITYTYIRNFDDSVTLDSVNSTANLLDEVDSDDENDIEDQVASFIEELGTSVPGKKDVSLITSMLTQALLTDS
jgi:hypothetical protein